VPEDVGWGRVAKRPDDFVGKRSLFLPEHCRSDRLQFVGLEAVDRHTILPVGGHIVRSDGAALHSDGYVTSSGFSPALGRGVSLARIRAGRARIGEGVTVTSAGHRFEARIVQPAAYDPEGSRLNV
jgi:sarcosine oxidase subunit alpha